MQTDLGCQCRVIRTRTVLPGMMRVPISPSRLVFQVLGISICTSMLRTRAIRRDVYTVMSLSHESGCALMRTVAGPSASFPLLTPRPPASSGQTEYETFNETETFLLHQAETRGRNINVSPPIRGPIQKPHEGPIRGPIFWPHSRPIIRPLLYSPEASPPAMPKAKKIFFRSEFETQKAKNRKKFSRKF